MIASLLLTAAIAIPPRTIERSVTAPVLQRQPLSQNGQRIASNGSLALCAWNDNGAVVASRIDANGTPIDVPGRVIAEQHSLADVFWNGDAFVVVASDYDTQFVFVTPEGSIAKRVALPPSLGTYATNTNEGASTRVLLLPFDAWTPNATLLDANAEVVKKGSNAAGSFNQSALAAWNGESFLVVRSISLLPRTLYCLSERLDRDGNVLSSEMTAVPFAYTQNRALAGNARGGGFALFDGRTMYRLDARGVAIGGPVTVQAPVAAESSVTRVFATKTDDGFAASWGVNLTSGRAQTFISRNGGTPEVTHDWPGWVSSAVMNSSTDLRAAAFRSFDPAVDDVFVQKENGEPRLASAGAPMQTNVAIAAGSNGFLAAWTEAGESGSRLMARLFSQFGEPQGDVVEVAQTTSVPRVVFAGGAYLIVWSGGARRLDAVTGEWIDPTPFVLDRVAGLGTDGQNALAITVDFCASPGVRCIAAQRIAMRGNPLDSALLPITNTISSGGTSAVALGWNGSEYLLAWYGGDFICPTCGTPPPRLAALRLHADGSRIDATPHLLGSNALGNPSVVWDGAQWVVAWPGRSGNAGVTFISREGAIGSDTEIVPSTAGAITTRVTALRWMDEAVVLTEQREPAVETTLATVVGGETSVVRKLIVTGVPFGPASAASSGSVLMFAYDRIDDASGHVERVFLDPRMLVSHRRIAR